MKTVILTYALMLVTISVEALHPGAARLRDFTRLNKRVSNHAKRVPSISNLARTIVNVEQLKPTDFLVNSSALPLITFPLQDSYAGRLPISSHKNETKQMFFWYWPSSAPTGSKTLTIWFTGGPGCSSLMGLSTENGPFLLPAGSKAPSYNKYNWATVSDMHRPFGATRKTQCIRIDEPIGVGFNLGTPNITNESQLADQFYDFLQQFYKVFPGLAKKQLYLSGESYAGFYIPYIASRIIHASAIEKKALPLDFQSFLIVDGLYSSFVDAQQAPVYNFVTKFQKYLNLNSTTVNQIRNISVSCGYQKLMDSITYPPKGKIPLPNGGKDIIPDGCDIWDIYNTASYEVNECFSHYKITAQCPELDPVEEIYFSKDEQRPDVQKALHVPNLGEWTFCSNNPVFVNDTDNSAYSESLFADLLANLPKGFSLWHGALDGILFSEGTKLAIQNLTWAGQQGFKKPITTPLIINGQQYGLYHTERKLTYIEFSGAGHMIPQDQPAAALHAFEWMLNGGNL
ncbi:Serine carboxypeptidase [Ceratobasidium sp. AG-Ba]|nr:Serine carboxypeptidase [Ceratobasidium sp. AG-Ba]